MTEAAANRTAENLIERIEREERLDAPAEASATLLKKVIKPGLLKDLLSGTPIGHPAHPVLVTVPIGAWLTASVLDLTGDDVAARRAVGLGVLTALPAAATGASDWSDTHGAEQRVGLVHAAANYLAIGMQAASWVARQRGKRSTGVALTLAANSVAGLAGWLGGHLSYAMGVGIDTTVFEQFPQDWTDAAAESDVPETGLGVTVAGVPVLLARTGGRITAIADRCTHRGAPLHEGEIADGCVVCPWHDSKFSLEDGSIEAGPATRPQPALDVEVRDGRVRVKRLEERTLRKGPVGV